jgi:hypothetical protein
MKFATIVKCSTMFWTCLSVVASLATELAADSATNLAYSQPRPLAIEPSNARDAAIRDCSVEVQIWSDRDWETTKSARYGACMTNHDEMQ